MQKTYTGIDVGTSHVKVVVAAPPERSELAMPILGTGTANAKGLRQGYITDSAEAAESIREALHRAATAAKTRIRRARVAAGGIGLEEYRASAEVTLTASGGVVSERDIERASRECEKRAAPKLANKTIIHVIPLEYRVDGAKVFGKPHGLQGTKLAADCLLITMLAHHHDELVETIERAGVEVESVMASPLAAGFAALSKAQKTAGVVLANVGAETLSLAVFDDDLPASVKVIPAGSADITNAIALTLQIPLAEAEQMKRGAVTGSTIPPRRMQVIVAARLREMFVEVNAHLKSIGRSRLLPAGVVITGGGSGLPEIANVARAVLRLPAQVSQIGPLPRSASVDATWTVAYGLARSAYADDLAESTRSFGDVLGSAWDSLKQTIRGLSP